MKKTLAFLFLLSITGIAVFSYPAMAACVAVRDNSLSPDHIELLQQARLRIESKFGSLQSKPSIYFFDQENEYWPLRLNAYGSTSFLGYKTCVAIGPKGQNVDVVAHELMHAEIEKRVGYWGRALRIPVWFDEGLAMQVDFRERYDIKNFKQTDNVTALISSSDFYSANRETLTYHYAAAKEEVSTWLSRYDDSKIYDVLSEIGRGTSFNSVWEQK